MRSNSNRKELIKQIIQTIEESFKDSMVIWKCTGTPSDDYTDDTEVFEAYMIEESDYDKLVDLKWKLRREIARPDGFTIQIHEFTPLETRLYREKEYLRFKAMRMVNEYERKKNVTPYGNVVPISFQIAWQKPRLISNDEHNQLHYYHKIKIRSSKNFSSNIPPHVLLDNPSKIPQQQIEFPDLKHSIDVFNASTRLPNAA